MYTRGIRSLLKRHCIHGRLYVATQVVPDQHGRIRDRPGLTAARLRHAIAEQSARPAAINSGRRPERERSNVSIGRKINSDGLAHSDIQRIVAAGEGTEHTAHWQFPRPAATAPGTSSQCPGGIKEQESWCPRIENCDRPVAQTMNRRDVTELLRLVAVHSGAD